MGAGKLNYHKLNTSYTGFVSPLLCIIHRTIIQSSTYPFNLKNKLQKNLVNNFKPSLILKNTQKNIIGANSTYELYVSTYISVRVENFLQVA